MKETISKVKRQPSEWEKIIANETNDKESPKYASSSCSSIPEKQTTQSKSGSWYLKQLVKRLVLKLLDLLLQDESFNS